MRLLSALVVVLVSAFAAPTSAPAAVQVGCRAGGPGTPRVEPRRDVLVGPLALLGARLTARYGPNAFSRHGYKIPVTVPAGVTVTLSVPRTLRRHVGFVFTHSAQVAVTRLGVRGGDSTVTFVPCPASSTTNRTGWPGGIVVDRRRCATLVAHIAGARGSVRRRVPLGRRC